MLSHLQLQLFTSTLETSLLLALVRKRVRRFFPKFHEKQKVKFVILPKTIYINEHVERKHCYFVNQGHRNLLFLFLYLMLATIRSLVTSGDHEWLNSLNEFIKHALKLRYQIVQLRYKDGAFVKVLGLAFVIYLLTCCPHIYLISTVLPQLLAIFTFC